MHQQFNSPPLGRERSTSGAPLIRLLWPSWPLEPHLPRRRPGPRSGQGSQRRTGFASARSSALRRQSDKPDVPPLGSPLFRLERSASSSGWPVQTAGRGPLPPSPPCPPLPRRPEHSLWGLLVTAPTRGEWAGSCPLSGEQPRSPALPMGGPMVPPQGPGSSMLGRWVWSQTCAPRCVCERGACVAAGCANSPQVTMVSIPDRLAGRQNGNPHNV